MFIEELIDLLYRFLPHLIAALHFLLAIAVSFHCVMSEKPVASKMGWIGLSWLSPYLGSILYFFFGINRIKKKAFRLRGRKNTARKETQNKGGRDFATLNTNLSGFYGVENNAIDIFIDANEAYVRMCEAIANASESVYLASYIFSVDAAGDLFVKALTVAQSNGVKVRVLVDSVGSRYSRKSIFHVLRQHNIECAAFLPGFSPLRSKYINLRNHRKILIVDERLVFVGGMNIREEYLNPQAIQDAHFRISGPIVYDLLQIFCEDWLFSTGENPGMNKDNASNSEGDAVCRIIPDGPDDDFEKIEYIYLSAITSAQRSIRIVTPYFLPSTRLVSALCLASWSGVSVEIIVPDENNLRLVDWASRPTLEKLFSSGCGIYRSAPPFDHSKLMLVDDNWSLIGSSNWDARSLYLNFEICVEVISAEFNEKLQTIFTRKRASSRQLVSGNFKERGNLVKFRDRIAEMFSPYL